MLKSVILAVFFWAFLATEAGANNNQIADLGKRLIRLSVGEAELQGLPYSIEALVLRSVRYENEELRELLYKSSEFEKIENCRFHEIWEEESCERFRCEADILVRLQESLRVRVSTQEIRNCQFVGYLRN